MKIRSSCIEYLLIFIKEKIRGGFKDQVGCRHFREQCGLGGELVGVLQLTYIPYLTHIGSWRCLIESVRVHDSFRGRGYGEQVLKFALDAARQKGCRLVQLTSDKSRVDAIRFYKKLGFIATHEGFKLPL